MARVGWVAAQADSDGGEPTWLRLSVFDDGWVEVPTFGRAVSAVRGNLRAALRTGLIVLVGLLAAWGLMRLSGATRGALSVVLAVLTVGVLTVLIVVSTLRLWRVRTRQLRRWVDDGDDVRRRKEAGTLPGRAPGAPMWRRAGTAAEFASWLTNTTLIRAADVAAVRLTPPVGDGSEHSVEVLLQSGVRRRYRSPDATLCTLLSRFDVTVR